MTIFVNSCVSQVFPCVLFVEHGEESSGFCQVHVKMVTHVNGRCAWGAPPIPSQGGLTRDAGEAVVMHSIPTCAVGTISPPPTALNCFPTQPNILCMHDPRRAEYEKCGWSRANQIRSRKTV